VKKNGFKFCLAFKFNLCRYVTEDRRCGRLLYADRHDSLKPDEVKQRLFLNLQSQRRILQLIGAPDQDSATANEEDAVLLAGQWGAGKVRRTREFREHLGVDFVDREVSQRARSAGFPSGGAGQAESS
jgi:hypothetical protein